jgi:hypothetical protein
MIAKMENVEETARSEGEVLFCNEDDLPQINYQKLGVRLTNCDDLYRFPDYASWLLLVLNNGDHRRMTTAKALAPIIVDRVPVQVLRDGNPTIPRESAVITGPDLGQGKLLSFP